MQPIKIESEHITLPFEVISELKGKEVQFIRFEDGFIMKPVTRPSNRDGKFSKLSKLRPRRLIIGDADELLNIKADEWNEPGNL